MQHNGVSLTNITIQRSRLTGTPRASSREMKSSCKVAALEKIEMPKQQFSHCCSPVHHASSKWPHMTSFEEYSQNNVGLPWLALVP